MALKTAEIQNWKVEVDGEDVIWFQRVIKTGGITLGWRKVQSPSRFRWNDKWGFWGGQPYGVKPEEIKGLEDLIRNA